MRSFIAREPERTGNSNGMRGKNRDLGSIWGNGVCVTTIFAPTRQTSNVICDVKRRVRNEIV